MVSVPEDLRQRLRQYGQEHVLSAWDRLSDPERRTLLRQLAAIDLDELKRLYEQRDKVQTLPPRDRIEPAPITRPDPAEASRLVQRGGEALSAGEVAVLVVAGGQGSRLGFDHPKGVFPIGPVSRRTLFQIHAEKVLALRRRHGASVPFLVMTSPATHLETVAFFDEQHHFGLPKEEVFFFEQGTMPALDLQAGRLLMETPGSLFLSPNGHGGTLTALADSGLLDRLRDRGVKHVFYFQVDNPLVKVAEPLFLGLHIDGRSEASSKVIAKEGPKDKLGVFVTVDGRCTIIEYSDLPDDMADERDESGNLRLWAGSPAIHVFDVAFLARVTQGAGRIPFHVARKKVPHVDESGREVKPEKENALKFERFIFDALPLAERFVLLEGKRSEEFAPLKNAEGADSPEAVRQSMSDLAAEWLARAGVEVPRRPDGKAAVMIEVSPLYALDAAELAAKVKPGTRIVGPTALE